jgi:hypothetical protein
LLWDLLFDLLARSIEHEAVVIHKIFDRVAQGERSDLCQPE